VTVDSAGGTVRRSVVVQAGSVSSLVVSAAASGIASGWLALSSAVPTRILENGVLLGTSDTPRILVPAGRHDLTFSNEELGYSVQRTVQVTAGQTSTVQLEAVRGTLSINAQPWAEVLVDGQRVGETPIGNLSLPIGRHELLFRHPQLGERRQTVTVAVGVPARVAMDLRK
jgi:hypothetical protein